MTRLFSFQIVEIFLSLQLCECMLFMLRKSCFIFLINVGTKNNNLLCTAAKCGNCASCEKMWSRESKTWIIYNFVKKYTWFIFLVSIFRFICESDSIKTYSLLLEQNSNNKICHFLKNAEYSF